MAALYTFVLKGFMAHFRKAETNSSSLSYFFPPPTGVQGIVAAMLGRERNSYYEELSEEHLWLSVALLTPLRKVTMPVNYIFATSRNQLNLSSSTPHTQIPLELVVAEDFPQRPLAYRIFLYPRSDHLEKALDQLFREQRPHYPLCLGSAFCPAWVEGWEKVEAPRLGALDEKPLAHTVVPAESLDPASWTSGEEKVYLRDFPVRSFAPGRKRKHLLPLVWEQKGRPIPVKGGETYFQVELKNGELWQGVLF